MSLARHKVRSKPFHDFTQVSFKQQRNQLVHPYYATENSRHEAIKHPRAMFKGLILGIPKPPQKNNPTSIYKPWDVLWSTPQHVDSKICKGSLTSHGILGPNHFQWKQLPSSPMASGKWKKHFTPNCQHICLGIPAYKFTFLCASKPAGSSKWTLFGFGILDTKSLFVNPRWKNSGTRTPREKTSHNNPVIPLTGQLSPFVLSWHWWKGLDKCISVYIWDFGGFSML